jgi:hypothetical protein
MRASLWVQKRFIHSDYGVRAMDPLPALRKSNAGSFIFEVFNGLLATLLPCVALL